MRSNFVYPNGSEFAFTILDDTDDTTVDNGRPVYDLFQELSIKTTKTVWAFDTPAENRGPYFAGETLSSSEYLKWIHELVNEGFEIAFHNATMGSSVREDTIRALDFIENEFNHPVRLHCNHGQNIENLYWGKERYNSFLLKSVLHLISKFRANVKYEGNNSKSEYFWADIAANRLSYIRAFAFQLLNGMNIPPGRPYQDLKKQKSPLFFNTADAPNLEAFNQLVNNSTIDRLRAENGWTVISTHLGKGFFTNNRLDPEFEKTMKYLASLPGWFVPVSELMDFLKSTNLGHKLSPFERARMEYSHVFDRIKSKVFSKQ